MSDQDPSQLRISDEERHQVAELLREAAGDGRIDLAELDERLEATYAAKTYGDLVPITLDLPMQGGLVRRPDASPVPGRTGSSLIAPGSDSERHVAIMGGAEIVVPPHVHVVMEGVGIMGGYAGPSGKVPEELSANSPTLRVKGVAIWGGVSVTRRHPKGA